MRFSNSLLSPGSREGKCKYVKHICKVDSKIISAIWKKQLPPCDLSCIEFYAFVRGYIVWHGWNCVISDRAVSFRKVGRCVFAVKYPKSASDAHWGLMDSELWTDDWWVRLSLLLPMSPYSPQRPAQPVLPWNLSLNTNAFWVWKKTPQIPETPHSIAVIRV